MEDLLIIRPIQLEMYILLVFVYAAFSSWTHSPISYLNFNILFGLSGNIVWKSLKYKKTIDKIIYRPLCKQFFLYSFSNDFTDKYDDYDKNTHR